MYDTIEAVHAKLISEKTTAEAAAFEQDINKYFVHVGIDWRLVNGQIVVRGDDAFREAVKTTSHDLKENQRPTAANRIEWALKALSARPNADNSGAISHSTYAVECVLHDITGETMTLGQYLNKHPGMFHGGLKKALEGIYGYASNAGARHGSEVKEPSFNEAFFVMTTCTAICNLLNAMHPNPTSQRSGSAVEEK